MSYFITEEQELIRNVARQFTEEEVKPRVSELYGPNSHIFMREMGKRMADLGFFNLILPESMGGLGDSMTTMLLVEEELSKECPALGLHVMLQGVCLTNFLPTPVAAEKWVPRILSGEYVVAYSMADPKGLANFSEWDDLAVLDGDEYVLNGSGRNFSTGGTFADVLLFWGMYKGDLMSFIVEVGAPGLTIHEEPKMGLGTSFGNYTLNNVRVTKDYAGMTVENKQEKENEGADTLSVLHISSMELGAAEGVLAKTIEFLKARTIAGQVAASRQDLQVKLVKMQTKIELLRALIYDASRLRDEGRGSENPALPHMCKAFADEVCVETARRCMQLHGGLGYCAETGIERYMRDAMGLSIGECTADMHRSTIAYFMGLPGARMGTF